MSSFNVDERYIIFWRQTEMWCACNRNVLVLERTETSMFESRPWNSLSSSHLRLVVNSRRHKHDITIEDTYLALSPLSEGARKRRTCVRSMIIVSNTKDNRNSPVTRVSDTKWYLRWHVETPRTKIRDAIKLRLKSSTSISLWSDSNRRCNPSKDRPLYLLVGFWVCWFLSVLVFECVAFWVCWCLSESYYVQILKRTMQKCIRHWIESSKHGNN